MFGLSSTFLPPAKLLSEALLKRSVKENVVVPFTGVPSLFSTKPPLPDEPVTQSPIPLIGVFARRSPSRAKPPAGTVTGAVPAGGGGQADAPSVWLGNNPVRIAVAASPQIIRLRLVFICCPPSS